ncbi:MAG TPA: flagellar FlbD family protein [Ignavibacteria bacterium]
MIEVTRTNHRKITINADMIVFVEETPDVVITLSNGAKVLVKESAREIVDKVIDYKRKIHQDPVFYHRTNV